jgi:hypothetical protein
MKVEKCKAKYGLTDIWAIPNGPQVCPYHWIEMEWGTVWARECLEKSKDGPRR